MNGVYEAVAAAEPNDPRATDQWGFNNANDADIDAYEVWNGGSSTAWDSGKGSDATLAKGISWASGCDVAGSPVVSPGPR